jgi:ATP-dependent RNA helicase DeaD
MIASDESNELNAIDIAAALLKLAMHDTSSKLKTDVADEPYINQSKATGAEHGMVRLFTNIGKMDKLEPKHIIDIITSNCDIDRSDIGAVDIYDKFSFIEVPLENADDVISSLNGYKLRGRKVNIEKANKKSR